MKSRSLLRKLIIIIAIFINVISSVNAQTGDIPISNAALYKEIAYMDSVVFNAFNTRNIDLFKTLFTEDLEFYHDKGGLTNYQHTVDFLKEISKSGNDLKRNLVKGSLEVYPIPGYGAMEIGSHIFCHTEKDKQDCGTFKFVHIWQKKNGEWKISRVVSYDH